MVPVISGILGLLAGAILAGVFVWNRQSKLAKSNMDEQTAIITAAGHSLRTHLNNILGQSQLLSSRSKQYRSEDRHLIDSVLGSSGELRRVLLDTLEIIELNTERLKIEKNEHVLQKSLTDLTTTQIIRARQNGTTLVVNQSVSTLAWFQYDDIRLCQCIRSILGQCIYQAKGAKIQLTADVPSSKKNDRVLTVRVTVPDAKLQIYQAEAYFSPKAFYRNQHLGKDSSWRLSVMLAQLVAREMGGDISVETDPAGDLHFILTVPVEFVKRAKSTEESMPLPPVPEAGDETLPVSKDDIVAHDEAKARLLIADDDSTNLMILEALLRACGYKNIVAVENGQETLEALANDPFDIVITDIQMPVMDGLACATAIRESTENWANIPIVAVSAAASAMDRAAVETAGINAFLPKPILKDELYVIVKEQLDKNKNATRKEAA